MKDMKGRGFMFSEISCSLFNVRKDSYDPEPKKGIFKDKL